MAGGGSTAARAVTCWIVHRAFGVGAYRERPANLLAEDDDGGLCVLAHGGSASGFRLREFAVSGFSAMRRDAAPSGCAMLFRSDKSQAARQLRGRCAP